MKRAAIVGVLLLVTAVVYAQDKFSPVPKASNGTIDVFESAAEPGWFQVWRNHQWLYKINEDTGELMVAGHPELTYFPPASTSEKEPTQFIDLTLQNKFFAIDDGKYRVELLSLEEVEIRQKLEAAYQRAVDAAAIAEVNRDHYDEIVARTHGVIWVSLCATRGGVDPCMNDTGATTPDSTYNFYGRFLVVEKTK